MSILSKIRQVINPKVVYLVVCHRCYNNNNNNNNNAGFETLMFILPVIFW